MQELIYPEFLEALAAVSCYRHPDPYSSLSTRLEGFLRHDFVPWVRQKFKLK